jgi:hypothetical protein
MIVAFLKERLNEIVGFLRSTWVVLAFAFIFCSLLFLFSSLSWEFWAEHTFGPSGDITETKIDRLKIVQQCGLFVLAIVGLVLAVWRSHTAYRQANAALAQSNTAIRQTEIAENNQRFDRYARAALMLDSEKSAVRQAGIYLLRELALADRNYRVICTELLASFIRSRNVDGMEKMASNRPIGGLLPWSSSDAALAAKLEFAGQETPHDAVDALKTLCLTCAGVKIEVDLRNLVFAKFSLDHHFNLANCDMTDCVFSEVSAYGAVFDDCTSIIGATFRYLDLRQANFREVSFVDVTFDNVEFEDVDFSGSLFHNCAFRQCTFKICNFSGVKFHRGDDQESTFDLQWLVKCWAWKDKVPELGVKFVGELYDPGSEGTERISFDNRREKRRVAGFGPSFKPNAKLKVTG